jgi:hypothetical protein
MRATCTLGVALAQHRAVGGGDHTTHTRVGRGQPQALLSQLQRMVQRRRLIGQRGHGGLNPEGVRSESAHK